MSDQTAPAASGLKQLGSTMSQTRQRSRGLLLQNERWNLSNVSHLSGVQLRYSVSSDFLRVGLDLA
jgi:hypothetical protein